MKRKIVLALSWTAVLALCIVIFIFSAKNAEQSSEQSSFIIDLFARIFGTEFTDFFIRKLAHMSEFAALGFFSANAFYISFKNIKKLYFAFAFSVLYAISDEIHQIFVPGRSCQFRDVLIDAAGIVIGIGVYIAVYYIFKLREVKKCTKTSK